MDWFFVVMLVVFALGITWAYVHHKRKVELWSKWCKARNWVFEEKVPQLVRAFDGGPFNRGSGRSARYGYAGTFDGLPIQGFDYQYSTGSGDNRQTHHYHVALVRLGGRFPRLSLSRENWASRTFSNDIQFENAQFNREWHVASPVPRFAHDVVHPRLMAWLQGDEIPRFEDLWFEDGCLLVSTAGSRRPEDVDPYLRLLTRFASQLPRFVLDEVGIGRLSIRWDGPGVSREEQARRLAQLSAGDGERDGDHGLDRRG